MPSTQLFASPLRFDDKWNPQPYLAESWKLADDGKSLTLNLRKDAVFHDGNTPAVWVVRGRDSTLELRPVSVRGYTAGSALIAAGLKDGDQVIQAGVHTVFVGQRVKPVRPLVDEDEHDSNAGAGGGPR